MTTRLNATACRPALLLATVLAAGCAERGVAPDMVRVGTDVDAESLDPRLTRNTTGYRVVNLLYDGLVQLDSGFEPRPSLARSWEHPEPRTWIFHLRETARFHDGTPLTAHDVAYTFQTLLDPDLNAPQRRLYTPIVTVAAHDDHTVRFTLREPYAPFLSYLDMGIVPRHLLERRHDLGNHPVGSGPYRLARWSKGSRIVLEANDDHWGGAPAIARVEVIVVPDNTARAQAFEAGDLDLIQSPLAPQDVRRLSRRERFLHRVMPGIAITYVNFNTANPLLADVRMRRALAMLVDQATIIEQIYERMDEPAPSLLPRISWAHAADVRQPRYDPRAAGALFDSLGWRDTDGDGLRDRNGRDLAIRVGTHSEDINRVQTVELIQNAFRQAGIRTKLELSDWASFSARRDAGDYEIILLGWTQIIDPDRVTFEQLHSSGGLNWGRYDNPRLDRLLERGRTAEHMDDRVAAYHAAVRIVAEELPYNVLSYQGYQAFWNPRVHGFSPDPRGMLRSLARSTATR